MKQFVAYLNKIMRTKKSIFGICIYIFGCILSLNGPFFSDTNYFFKKHCYQELYINGIIMLWNWEFFFWHVKRTLWGRRGQNIHIGVYLTLLQNKFLSTFTKVPKDNHYIGQCNKIYKHPLWQVWVDNKIIFDKLFSLLTMFYLMLLLII